MRTAGILLSILVMPWLVSASEDPLFDSLHYELEKAGEILAKGDYNNDGYLDLAAYVNGNVRLFPGNGDGSFVNSEDNDIASVGFNDIEMADLDRDGNLDLIESGGPRVFVRLGNGDGTFGASQSFETASDSAEILACDLNGDNLLDLAVGNHTRFRANVLLGKGDGTFHPQISIGPTGAWPRTLVAADFNNDEQLDLAFACFKANIVSIMLNIGGGNFDAPASLVTGQNPQDIGAGDFNEDGDVDLVVLLEEDIHLYPGDGQGGFGSPFVFTNKKPNPGLEVEDFNEDGHLDMVFPSRLGWIGVMLGLGDGTFEQVMVMKSVRTPHTLISGDWDNDGELDLAAIDFATDGLAISLGLGDGTFGPHYYTFGVPMDVELTDLDGNGVLEMVTAGNANGVFVHEGLGNGRFSRAVNYFTGTDTKPGVVVSGDFTDDGVTDIAVASQFLWNTGKICLLPGGGDLTLGPTEVMEIGVDLRDLVVGDLNKDQRPDLVAVSHGSNTLHVLLGKAGGGFEPAEDYVAQYNPTGVTLGDFNEDTHLDAVVCYDDNSDTLQLFLNNGDGTLTPQYKINTPYTKHHIRSADLNGDNHLDLVTTTSYPVLVGVYLGDGTGGFSPIMKYEPSLGPERFDIGDVDNDDIPDVVVAHRHVSFDDGFVSIFLGNGDGTLQSPFYLELMMDVMSASLADLDRDGTLDIAAAVYNGGLVTVMLNRHGPWDDLGHSLPGTFGHAHQTGEGPLVGGAFFRFSLSDGMPLSAAYHVIGISQVNLPFKGGVMVPSAELITGPFPLDGQGRFEFEAAWPVGVPAMSELYFQFWFQDSGGPLGFAATNGLKATTP